ncbi:putative ribonuclease H-like domain-containing protein [Tanacetum coccineum]
MVQVSLLKMPIKSSLGLYLLPGPNDAYGVSTSSGHNSQKEGSSSYTDELKYSFFANQSSGPQLDHEDLKQVDEFDLEEMDLKWQVAMISMRMKKFYKKTGRRLQFDAKEPVGFDKTKVECFNCHNTRHFAREYKSKGNQESRRRDAGNTRYKAKDNRRRPRKQEEPKALVTLDGEGVDWTGHVEDEQENFALMAYNNSGSDTEEQLGDASIEIQAYTQALKKVEAQLVAHQKNQLWSSDVEDSPVNDRFGKVEGMHAVPPPMTGNYMPPKFDFGIDESNFTYGPKQSKTSESDAKTSDFDSCETNSSVETLESVPEPIVVEPKVVSQPKVWSDAPIIEEYESDSDDEYVIKPSKEQEKPSFAFVNTVKHVKTPRETVNEQNTCSPSPKVDKRDLNGSMYKRLGLGYGFTKKACFKGKGTGQGENRHVWNNVQRLNHQNKFVPKADDPQEALKNKGIIDSGCSRHMTGNKAYLVEYQDYNGGPIAFRGQKGSRENSNARTPQQNIVAERKNRTLIEDARTMLADSFLPNTFWAEVPITAGPKEANQSAGTQDTIDAGNSQMETEPAQKYFVLPVWHKDQGDQAFLEELERLKRQEKEANDAAKIKPKKISQALKDESLVDAMQEELLQFKIQKVWILVDLPFGTGQLGKNRFTEIKKDKRIEAIRIFLAFASCMGFIV